jgi:DNA-binding XRE family transcriptional regulator
MPEEILPDPGSGYQPRPRTDRPAAPSCPRFKRTPELHALGRAVLELRARRSLTQEQLGADAALHRNYVGAIERGEINPTFRVLLKLCAGLRLPLSELMAVRERHEQEHDRPALRVLAGPRTDDR